MATALLALVALALTPAAEPVTLPPISAVVAPSTVPDGRLTPTATAPPVPPSDCPLAKLSEVAAKLIAPLEVSEDPLPALACVKAPVPMSAPAPAAPSVTPSPKLTVVVVASASLLPLAFTLIDTEPVTVPSSVASTSALIPVCETIALMLSARPKVTLSTFAVAVFLTRLAASGHGSPAFAFVPAAAVSASTHMAPEVFSEASEPTSASIAAPRCVPSGSTPPVISASEKTPPAPPIEASSWTTGALAVLSPYAVAVIEVDDVTLPSSLTRVAPPTSAIP